jgi:hypothetical protein
VFLLFLVFNDGFSGVQKNTAVLTQPYYSASFPEDKSCVYRRTTKKDNTKAIFSHFDLVGKETNKHLARAAKKKSSPVQNKRSSTAVADCAEGGPSPPRVKRQKTSSSEAALNTPPSAEKRSTESDCVLVSTSAGDVEATDPQHKIETQDSSTETVAVVSQPESASAKKKATAQRKNPGAGSPDTSDDGGGSDKSDASEENSDASEEDSDASEEDSDASEEDSDASEEDSDASEEDSDPGDEDEKGQEIVPTNHQQVKVDDNVNPSLTEDAKEVSPLPSEDPKLPPSTLQELPAADSNSSDDDRDGVCGDTPQSESADKNKKAQVTSTKNNQPLQLETREPSLTESMNETPSLPSKAQNSTPSTPQETPTADSDSSDDEDDNKTSDESEEEDENDTVDFATKKVKTTTPVDTTNNTPSAVLSAPHAQHKAEEKVETNFTPNSDNKTVRIPANFKTPTSSFTRVVYEAATQAHKNSRASTENKGCDNAEELATTTPSEEDQKTTNVTSKPSTTPPPPVLHPSVKADRVINPAQPAVSSTESSKGDHGVIYTITRRVAIFSGQPAPVAKHGEVVRAIGEWVSGPL